jgi:hypothetical protein
MRGGHAGARHDVLPRATDCRKVTCLRRVAADPRDDRRDGHGTRGNPTLSPLTVGMWTAMTMTGGVDGASLKIGAKSFTEEALLAAITKIELGNVESD